MPNPSNSSSEGRWEVIKPPQPLTINREALRFALQYAIEKRSYVELTIIGGSGESELLKEWQRMLAILERDEPVHISSSYQGVL